MKILAIEASGLVAGCAVMEDMTLLGEYSVCFKKTHSQTLLPMVDQLKTMLGLDLQSLDAIALTKGPGSFTGLRIGAATAKGLGLALDLPIIGVPTTDSLAYNLFGTDALVVPLMDARRQQVYTGIYEEHDRPVTLRKACAVPVSEIIEDVNLRGREVIFLGDGVPVYQNVIEEECTVPFLIAPAHLFRQRAASTAALAEYLFAQKGEAVLEYADDFRPEYLRMSQAERERCEQMQKDPSAAKRIAAGVTVQRTEEGTQQ